MLYTNDDEKHDESAGKDNEDGDNYYTDDASNGRVLGNEVKIGLW